MVPARLAADSPAPLLLAHDGSDMAERGSLLSWATAMSRELPIRVALLDPPHGLRDLWYSANPDYSDHLADVVLPAITARVLTGPVIGLGASLGALAMLDLQRRHPGSISAAGPAVRLVLHQGPRRAGEQVLALRPGLRRGPVDQLRS